MTDLNDSLKKCSILTIVSSNNKRGHRWLNGMIIGEQYEVHESEYISMLR